MGMTECENYEQELLGDLDATEQELADTERELESAYGRIAELEAENEKLRERLKESTEEMMDVQETVQSGMFDDEVDANCALLKELGEKQ